MASGDNDLYLGSISTFKFMNFSSTEAYIKSSTVARFSLSRTSCMRLQNTINIAVLAICVTLNGEREERGCGGRRGAVGPC